MEEWAPGGTSPIRQLPVTPLYTTRSAGSWQNYWSGSAAPAGAVQIPGVYDKRPGHGTGPGYTTDIENMHDWPWLMSEASAFEIPEGSTNEWRFVWKFTEASRNARPWQHRPPTSTTTCNVEEHCANRQSAIGRCNCLTLELL